MNIQKPRWILTIIILVELSSLVLIALYKYGLMDLKDIVGKVIDMSFIVVGGVIVIVILHYLGIGRKDKIEEIKIENLNIERKTLENQIETHNNNLIHNVFKHWYINKFLFNWYDLPTKNITEFKEFLQNSLDIKYSKTAKIEKKDDNTIRVFYDLVENPNPKNRDDTTYLTLNLNDDKTKVDIEIYNGITKEFAAKEENGKLNVYEINPIDKKQKILALEHLKNYTDSWKLREDSITLQDSISKEEIAINEYILTRLEQSTLLNFTRDCSSDEGEVVMCLYNIIKSFSSAGGVPDTYKLHPQNNPGVGCAFTFNKNKQELIEHYENSRKQNEIIVKDKTLNEMIGKLVNDKVLLTTKKNEFEQSIKMLVYKFENKHIPLEGTCDDCSDWYDKLESLK